MKKEEERDGEHRRKSGGVDEYRQREGKRREADRDDGEGRIDILKEIASHSDESERDPEHTRWEIAEIARYREGRPRGGTRTSDKISYGVPKIVHRE